MSTSSGADTGGERDWIWPAVADSEVKSCGGFVRGEERKGKEK
jgi:hypothetical protein